MVQEIYTIAVIRVWVAGIMKTRKTALAELTMIATEIKAGSIRVNRTEAVMAASDRLATTDREEQVMETATMTEAIGATGITEEARAKNAHGGIALPMKFLHGSEIRKLKEEGNAIETCAANTAEKVRKIIRAPMKELKKISTTG